MCDYFALCPNEPAGVLPNPVLGDVATCKRCADKMGFPLRPLPGAAPVAPGSKGQLEITHTHLDGTQLHGSSKGDGVWELLKGDVQRWGFSRGGGPLYVRQSRDRNAHERAIVALAAKLVDAGWLVDIDIDNAPRATADVEADRVDRNARRVDGLAARAERLDAASDAKYEAAKAALDGIVPGQPILVGHHSERRHRNAIEKSDNRMRASVELGREAKSAAEASAAAEANQRHRESAGTTLRRIEKLEAEARGHQRELDGYTHVHYVLPDGTKVGDTFPPATGARREQVEARLARVEEQIRYWRGHIAKLESEGLKVWGPADFTKGDYVRFRFGWALVKRVNPKSLTVPHMEERLADKYTWKVPYDDVKGRRSAEEHARALADAAARAADGEAAPAG